jgi:hypothetical protein
MNWFSIAVFIGLILGIIFNTSTITTFLLNGSDYTEDMEKRHILIKFPLYYLSVFWHVASAIGLVIQSLMKYRICGILITFMYLLYVSIDQRNDYRKFCIHNCIKFICIPISHIVVSSLVILTMM